MIYHLNETEIKQIQTWIPQIQEYYAESDAVQLAAILQNALSKGFMDENEIYRLLNLLPHIIPKQCEEMKEADDAEEIQWDAYIDEQQARYKREIDKFRQMLSNWIFLQNAVYQRNLKALSKPIDSGVLKGNNQGLKKNR